MTDNRPLTDIIPHLVVSGLPDSFSSRPHASLSGAGAALVCLRAKSTPQRAGNARYTMTKINDTRDSRIVQMRALQGRREREKTRRFWTEGLKFVAQAVQNSVELEVLLWVPKLLTHPKGQSLVRQCRERNVQCWEVTPEVFLSLSRAEDPQWIGAVGRQQWTKMADAPASAGLCWLALDTVQSPGNLGTILRTCEAVGAAGVILLGPQADPYDPSAVRATMGALFAQRLVRADWATFADWKQRHGCLLVGTSPSAPLDYRAVEYRTPTVLWMGWERRGLTAAQQTACDVMARIPMVAGRTDSLNLAVSTGVMLYEIYNQRQPRCERQSERGAARGDMRRRARQA